MSDEKKVDYKVFIRDLYRQTWEHEFIIEIEDRGILCGKTGREGLRHNGKLSIKHLWSHC